MIVRTLKKIIGTESEVKTDTMVSRRLLSKDDNMGFSYHDATIYAGTETHVWYKNHLEALYCISGEGEVETVSDGKVYPIKDGTMFATDKNDELYLGVTKDMRVISVFNPPLS